jgi:hypothetical protein
MSKALEDLLARLQDLEADLTFVSLSSRLRPRLSNVLNWSASHEALALAREFMNAKSARIEGLLGPLLVRLSASLERYTRALVEEAVVMHAEHAASYDDVLPHIRTRNLVLTGSLLAYSESPREHINLNLDMLIDNLASCRLGSTSYRLNAPAFGAAVVGCSPQSVEKALGNLGVNEWWDKVGAAGDLALMLGTKGSRATGKMARGKLEELWRWRNQVAHGGDEEVALTEEQLREAVAFVRAFSSALDVLALARFRGHR